MRRRDFLAATGMILVSAAAGIQAQQSQQLQQSSIIFHWESLPEGFYPKSQEEKQRVESLILEAAEQFNSTLYVPEPIDFTSTKLPTKIYFKESLISARCYLGREKNIIDFNKAWIQVEGPLLATAFHEFGHIYDRFMGYAQEMMAIWDSASDYESLTWQHQSTQASGVTGETNAADEEALLKYTPQTRNAVREYFEGEIRNCTRSLPYIETLRKRMWAQNYPIESYIKEVLQRREKFKAGLGKTLQGQ